MAYMNKSKQSFIEAGENKAFPGKFGGPKQLKFLKKTKKRKQKKMEKVKGKKQLITQPAGYSPQKRQEYLVPKPSQPKYQMGMNMNLPSNLKRVARDNITARIRRATGG